MSATARRFTRRNFPMRLESSDVDILLSRLLHDLIGPVTATVNGIELIEEFGGKSNDSIAAEALDLIGSSARQTADRLSYFRVAFGAAGNTEAHSLDSVRRLAEAYLNSRKIALDFSTDTEDSAKPGAGIAKTVLAAIFLMADALPRSGSIRVEIDAKANWTAAVTAQGPGSSLEADSVAGLNGTALAAPISTRTVIGAMVGHTARRFGIDLEVHGEPDLARVTFRPNPPGHG
jgi:histidine phosphotransferase ChpT